ncbi:HNH endonuclease [Pseudonocardia sp. TRM90224]|uniref:HNH endonuclease n=1 Tax=Pseudonocardia sp. TRM90224 TaxID=2812678 RepID=UPI001E506F55|nr:HNH endonuclease signature motif containing protein [Pseudonocardia sp. TRM90224]
MSENLQTALAGVAQLQADTLVGTFEVRCSSTRELEVLGRRVDFARICAISAFVREGGFHARGYKSPIHAIRDLWNLDHNDAQRYVTAAEHICPQITLDGQVLAPRLPASAAAFEAGTMSLRHVEKIAQVLGSKEAGRLTPADCAYVEAQLAGQAAVFDPKGLFTLGMRVVRSFDQDGPEPDDGPESEINELTITRHPDRPGGTIKGRFDNAVLFATIATLIDAKSKPTTADDQRSTGQRQAEALADICGYVLDHGDVPHAGGHRPHLNVHIPLTELENRVRTAILDFGGTITTRDLRLLACNAAVIPIVMNGDSQPLDIGRANRVIPDGMRRAVAARDRGCARCGRPASWCDVHHIVEWQNGGPTEVNNLVMLCKMHHREIHATEWIVQIADGLPEFIPPRWVDPDQIPRHSFINAPLTC